MLNATKIVRRSAVALLPGLVALASLSSQSAAAERVTLPAFKQRGVVAVFNVADLRGKRVLKAYVRTGRRYRRVSGFRLRRGVRRGVLRLRIRKAAASRRRWLRHRSRRTTHPTIEVAVESARRADTPQKSTKSKKKSELSVVVEASDSETPAEQSKSSYTSPSGPKSTLVPPGSPVLSDADAAAKVSPSEWEPRPGNTTANHRVPTPSELSDWREVSNYSGVKNGSYYISHVTGNYTGTTDEILRWAAWKWGFDEDLLRAQTLHESTWYQSAVGDGGISFGLLQLKSTRQTGTFPLSRDSTAFNVDYAMMILRHCYDGHATWLDGGYAAGDFWGCLGYFYSGHWYDEGAQRYMDGLRSDLAERAWENPGF